MIKFGNVERFYFCFYLIIVLNVVKYFEGLLRNVVILLFIKVVDCMLVYSKEEIESIYICILLIKFLDEEKVGL